MSGLNVTVKVSEGVTRTVCVGDEVTARIVPAVRPATPEDMARMLGQELRQRGFEIAADGRTAVLAEPDGITLVVELATGKVQVGVSKTTQVSAQAEASTQRDSDWDDPNSTYRAPKGRETVEDDKAKLRAQAKAKAEAAVQAKTQQERKGVTEHLKQRLPEIEANLRLVGAAVAERAAEENARNAGRLVGRDEASVTVGGDPGRRLVLSIEDT